MWVPLDELEPKDVRRRYASYGDFAKLNARWNKSRSSTTHERLEGNPEEWCYYHTRMMELESAWAVNPRDECIEHLNENVASNSAVGDFGCGRALIAEAVKDIHTVNSFDHIAVNDDVIKCDMINTPLDDESLDIAIFSLSLMGSNIREYILEAYRTLRVGGQLLIYHPAEKNDLSSFNKGLKDLGFAIIESGQVYKWHKLWAIKQGTQPNKDAECSFK